MLEAKSQVPMSANLIFSKSFSAAPACVALAFLVCGCGKPAPQPAKPAAQSGQSTRNTEVADLDLATAAVRILNTAHRNGAVILRGQCGLSGQVGLNASNGQSGQVGLNPSSVRSGAGGIADQYPLHAPVTLEPMDKALQEVQARQQNIYWRESRASGVRVVDSAAKAGLLRVKVWEFRMVEDREPDGAMAALWRAPEVAAFLRKNHIHFARRMGATKKAISPPMIVEMKKTTVADILDRIAAGYRADPPRVWIYRECSDKKETLVDVQMK